MCMLIAKFGGVAMPDKATIRRCAVVNADGIGVAYAVDGKVYIKKDFKSTKEFYKWGRDVLRPEIPALIHFRLATHGARDMGARHPFPITKSLDALRAKELVTDLAFAHNGIFQGLDDKVLSDSQVFVRDVLAEPNVRANIKSEAILKLIEKYIGSSKVAFLDNTGAICTLGNFVKHEGLMFSNEGFKEYSPTRWNGTKNGANCSRSYYSDDYEDYYGYLYQDGGYPHPNWEYCSVCYEQFPKGRLVTVGPKNQIYNTYTCIKCFKSNRKADEVIDLGDNDNVVIA